MKIRPAFPRFLRALSVLAVVALAGCATQEQVRDIVRSSNYEVLVASDPALAMTVPADADKGTKPTPAAAERLTAFLQANPDDPVLGPTLHLRQALLYLNERQFDLAQAAFDQIKGAKLTTARDEALVAAFPTIKWWSQWSLASGGVFRGQRTDALAKMQLLADQAAAPGLAQSPDVSAYFLEMRAWIGLKAGFAVVLPADAEFQVQTLQSAVDLWTKTFSSEELAMLNNPQIDAKLAFTLSTRRVLRLRTLLDTLATVAKSGGTLVPPPAVHFAAPAAQTYYEAKLAAP